MLAPWPWCPCSNGHGTHVAGILSATGNNGLGVVGVNWQVGVCRQTQNPEPQSQVKMGHAKMGHALQLGHPLAVGAALVGAGCRCRLPPAARLVMMVLEVPTL